MNRRTLLTSTLAAASVAVASKGRAEEQRRFSEEALGPTLMTMVYLSKRLDASTKEFRAWYINQHAPDFVSFARPYLERYTQHFVERPIFGRADFDCISEFAFPSRAAMKANVEAVDRPENRNIIARHPRIGSKPGPNEAHDGPRRYSVDQHLLSGSPRGYDAPGSRKQGVFASNSRTLSAEDFAHDVIKFGSRVARDHADAIERLVVNVSVRDQRPDAPIFDAVYLIWPKRGKGAAEAFRTPPTFTTPLALELLSYEPNLGVL